MPEEAVDVWRPAAAEHLRDDVYRILGTPPEDEVWQFQMGEIVRCKWKRLMEGIKYNDVLVAIERVGAQP